MLGHLNLSIFNSTHRKTLRYYLKPDLLIVDLGIRAMTREDANDLYEIIIEHHEIKSTFKIKGCKKELKNNR